MGVYDTVLVNCPNCGLESEFQSKSGNCKLANYTLEDCPSDVLANVNRHSPNLCECGTLFEVDIEKRKSVVSTKTTQP